MEMLVGRTEEIQKIQTCIAQGRNVLIEGPVGVGKTLLATAVAKKLGRPVFRVDGDGRFSEQKLSGWFDPAIVMHKGFVAEAFVAGPLVEAMKKGGILFINELNRMPEGVQNVLLPALDEKRLFIPKMGEVQAASGFAVIATQNPREFVATSHLSEALLDRFEWIFLDYPSEDEEFQIVQARVSTTDIAKAAVKIGRLSRKHPHIRRGASLRGSLAVAELAHGIFKKEKNLEAALFSAAKTALPTRIEIEIHPNETDYREQVEKLIAELVTEALGKKKP